MKVPSPVQSASRAAFSRLTRRDDERRQPVQAGALPWRRGENGKIEVLLITSRSSGRWIIPKGRAVFGKTTAEAAAIEAYEEAGVEGVIAIQPLGRFEHTKSHWLKGSISFVVVVHPLEVKIERSAWPEQAERQRRWVSRAEAANLVSSKELSALFRAFRVEE